MTLLLEGYVMKAIIQDHVAKLSQWLNTWQEWDISSSVTLGRGMPKWYPPGACAAAAAHVGGGRFAPRQQ